MHFSIGVIGLCILIFEICILNDFFGENFSRFSDKTADGWMNSSWSPETF